jgi:hypothetical protein
MLTLLLSTLLAVTLAAPASAGGTTVGGTTASTSFIQSSDDCGRFSERQMTLADDLLEDNDFTGALKALNRAAESCDSGEIRERIASVMGSWHRFIRRYGSPADLEGYLGVLSNQPHLEAGARSALADAAAETIASFITEAYDAERFERANGLCGSFSPYIDDVARLRYVCGASAEAVGELRAAASDYRWVMNNWTDEVPVANRDSVARALSEVYLLTAQFGQALTASRDVAARNPNPEVLLGALGAIRGKFLEPAARGLQVMLSGSPSPAALAHVRSEMERIDFPPYVGGIYTTDGSGGTQRTFYEGGTISPPPAEEMAAATGSVSLLRSGPRRGPMWILTPVDDRYLVVQFDTSTEAEENVILENLLEAPTDDEEWTRLYDYEYDRTSPATGSVVATLVGGTYLADGQVSRFDGVFDDQAVLDYYCVQNGAGEVVATHRFSRSEITYEDGAWERSSETPALYRHEVKKDGRPMREVVWPTYDGEDWSGVVRVGLTSD